MRNGPLVARRNWPARTRLASPVGGTPAGRTAEAHSAPREQFQANFGRHARPKSTSCRTRLELGARDVFGHVKGPRVAPESLSVCLSVCLPACPSAAHTVLSSAARPVVGGRRLAGASEPSWRNFIIFRRPKVDLAPASGLSGSLIKRQTGGTSERLEWERPRSGSFQSRSGRSDSSGQR